MLQVDGTWHGEVWPRLDRRGKWNAGESWNPLNDFSNSGWKSYDKGVNVAWSEDEGSTAAEISSTELKNLWNRITPRRSKEELLEPYPCNVEDCDIKKLPLI